MENKKTAVEWFIEQLTKNPLPQSKDEFIDGDLVHIINKAKKIEKEHIIDAFAECWKANMPDGFECKLSAKEYYEESFNQH